jgi:hypothetical protein
MKSRQSRFGDTPFISGNKGAHLCQHIVARLIGRQRCGTDDLPLPAGINLAVRRQCRAYIFVGLALAVMMPVLLCSFSMRKGFLQEIYRAMPHIAATYVTA